MVLTVSDRKHRDSAVLADERRQHLLDLIARQGFVALADLVRQTQVSESTIRRDLDHLHDRGLVRRTHGGAMFTGDDAPLPGLEERSAKQLDEKRTIARAAVARIRDGDA